MKIIYDKTVRRFRYENGSFASREAVIYQSRKYLKNTQSEFIELGRQLYNKPGDPDIERQMVNKLKDIHITNGVIAAGGSDRMFANDFLTIGRVLRSQYGQSENTPSEYGLKFLYEEVINGKVSEARLTQRLEMYAKSGKTSYFAVEKDKRKQEGKTQAKRKLGSTDYHCKECKKFSSLGYVPISELVIPTQGCSCLTNCKCTVVYM